MNNSRGRDKFYKYQKIIYLFILIVRILPYKCRLFLFNRARMLQGNVGLAVRYVLLKTLAQSVGNNVSIHPSVYIFNIDRLCVGDNVSIHPMCYIEAKGGIEIGKDVSIAHSVTLLSVNHVFKDTEKPIKDQGIICNKTIIESNVWLGAKSCVLSGVKIGNGSVVAAGAVVTKNINSKSVVAGVPATLIYTRT